MFYMLTINNINAFMPYAFALKENRGLKKGVLNQSPNQYRHCV
jgi:hypothetical protein